MEEKIDFAKVPYQYSMCLNRQCPQAGTCLRQLTEQSVPENIEHWIIISPKYLSTVIRPRIHRNLRESTL